MAQTILGGFPSGRRTALERPLRLNHLNLPAHDPSSLRGWYVEILGFAEHGRFLWSGGTLLVFVEGEPLQRADAHLGFRVDSLPELHEWVDRMRARGFDPGNVEGDETYSTVFFEDPEGNRVELFYEPVPD